MSNPSGKRSHRDGAPRDAPRLNFVGLHRVFLRFERLQKRNQRHTGARASACGRPRKTSKARVAGATRNPAIQAGAYLRIGSWKRPPVTGGCRGPLLVHKRGNREEKSPLWT